MDDHSRNANQKIHTFDDLLAQEKGFKKWYLQGLEYVRKHSGAFGLSLGSAYTYLLAKSMLRANEANMALQEVSSNSEHIFSDVQFYGLCALVPLLSVPVLRLYLSKKKENFVLNALQENKEPLSSRILSKLPSIAWLGLVAYTQYKQFAYTEYIEDMISNNPQYANHPEILTNTELVQANSNMFLTFTPLMYYTLNMLIDGSKFLTSKFIPKKAVLKNFFNVSWTYELSQFVSTDKGKHKRKTNVSTPKRNGDSKVYEKYEVLFYERNDLSKYRLLEDVLLELSDESIKVRHKDLSYLMFALNDINDIDLTLYGAALSRNKAPKLSKYLLDFTQKTHPHDFNRQALTVMYHSLFSQKIPRKESLQLIHSIQNTSLEKKESTEKTVEITKGNHIDRVLKYSENDFFNAWLVDLALSRQHTHKQFFTEQPIVYTQHDNMHYAVSLRLKGVELSEILGLQKRLNKNILKEVLQTSKQYYAALNSLQENGQLTVNYQGKNQIISIESAFDRSYLRNRIFQFDGSRFHATQQSEQVLDFFEEAIAKRARKNTLIDSDMSSHNIFYDATTQKYSIFDSRLKKGLEEFMYAKLLAQAQTNLPLSDKQELLLQNTNIALEDANFALFLNLFTEAGSDLGHDRNKIFFKRKLEDMAKLAPNITDADIAMNYLKTEGYIHPQHI